MEKKLKLSSDDAYTGSNKCKHGYVGTYGTFMAASAFGGSLESGGRYCVCVWQESDFNSVGKVFMFYFLRTFKNFVA
jgi:hypothetical protein